MSNQFDIWDFIQYIANIFEILFNIAKFLILTKNVVKLIN